MRQARRFKILASAVLSVLFVLSSFIQAEIYYPWKDVFIGALDAAAWPGLVIAADRENAFAFCVSAEKNGALAEFNDFYALTCEVGPHSPDGQYSRVRFDLGLPFGQGKETPVRIKPAPKSDTITLEWSRQDEKTVLGRLRYPEGIRISLVFYCPWDCAGSFDLRPDGQVLGQSGEPEKQSFVFWANRPGEKIADRQGHLRIQFSTDEDRSICFVAAIGKDERSTNNHIYRYKNRKTIDSILRDEENSYQQKRVRIRGLYKDVPESIADNLFWTVLYQAGQHRLYAPAGRSCLFPRADGRPEHWTIFEWDSFLSALELAVESPKHAIDAVQSVLETQYPDGNIPHWRGRFGGTPDRSQPPIGAYVALKLFQRTGDMSFLKKSYPYLTKWHSFWTAKKADGQSRRDGNGDGLLEWGTDLELLIKDEAPAGQNITHKRTALEESGQEDLANWDEASFSEETGTLRMNCLDLNCLYALDAWCLAQMADILELEEESQKYRNDFEKMKSLINAGLWNEKEGFYFDRHWDGRFSSKTAASNFYPLIARIPDEKRALRLIKHILDPKKFWGEFVIPTIARDDPSFKEQKACRGPVRPQINYLIYQGLKAYGFDHVAADFAKKSSDLFLRSWSNFQICPEYFDSRTGEAGGERYQSCGPLLALIALEEYLDFTPWEGFRFGMIKPEGKGTLSRIAVQGRHYDIGVSPSKILLREEGKEIIQADGGSVFRRFLYNENEVSFDFKSLDNRELTIWFLKKGKYQLLIDAKEVKAFSGRSVEFKVPAGDHSILILLTEEKE